LRLWLVALYIVSISTANIITAAVAPLAIGAFIVPAGTLFIGATFILRDFVQNTIGKRKTYAVIAAALALSASVSFMLGDTLWITVASAITFALSETADTEVYSRLKTTFTRRVFISGIIGGTLDSAVFVIIGLSPLGAGFLPWDVVGYAIVGQAMVKGALQVIGAVIIVKTAAARRSPA